MKKLIMSTNREALLKLELVNGRHVRPAQKTLLQFASIEDLENIYRCKNRTQEMKEIVALVQAGEWEKYLEKYSKIEDAHYILLAAYSYTKPELSETELMDAFEFLSIAKDVGEGNYKICRKNAGNDKFDLKFGKTSFNTYLSLSDKELEDIPEHERVGIAVRTVNFLDETKDIVPPEIQTNLTTFIRYCVYVNKVCTYQFEAKTKVDDKDSNDTWTMCPSTAIVKFIMKDEENQQAIKPVLAFTSRDDYLEDLANGYSQVALLTPDTAKKTFVHGFTDDVKGASVFRRLHDAVYHTLNRIMNKIPKDKEMMTFIMDLDAACKAKKDIGVPLIERGYIYPRLAEGASQQDFTTKILMDYLGNVIDATANLARNESGELIDAEGEIISAESYIGKELDKLIQRHTKKEDSPLINKEEKIANITPEMAETAKKEFIEIILPLLQKNFEPKNQRTTIICSAPRPS